MEAETLKGLIDEILATVRTLDRDREVPSIEPVTIEHEGFKEAVREMHGGGSHLPCDLIFADAVRILDALSDRVEWGEGLDTFEVADGLTEVSTHRLTEWLHHDPEGVAYLDDAIEEHGDPASAFNLLAYARCRCLEARVNAAWEWLTEEAEDGEE